MCVLFNCICSPGRLDGCNDFSCSKQDAVHELHLWNGTGRDLVASCTAHHAMDPHGQLCWQHTPFGYIFFHQSTFFPMYNMFCITIPSLIIGTVLWMFLASPCTVVDPTCEKFKESKVRDCVTECTKWSMWFLAVIALLMWLSAVYFCFTEWFHRIVPGLPEVPGEWVTNHWLLIPKFLVARVMTYNVQVVCFWLMAFNPWAMTWKSDATAAGGIKEGHLHWWCDPDRPVGYWIGFLTDTGRYHFERKAFLDRASEIILQLVQRRIPRHDGSMVLEDPGWQLQDDEEPNWKDRDGVHILSVERNSAAERAGFKRGMRVRRVNEVKVQCVQELEYQLEHARKQWEGGHGEKVAGGEASDGNECLINEFSVTGDTALMDSVQSVSELLRAQRSYRELCQSGNAPAPPPQLASGGTAAPPPPAPPKPRLYRTATPANRSAAGDQEAASPAKGDRTRAPAPARPVQQRRRVQSGEVAVSAVSHLYARH
eukprot:gene26472-6587_t